MTISSKPHIVLVDTWRVVNAKGGTEKVFCEMANALVCRGYRVTAICHDENIGTPAFPLDDSVNFVNAYHPASIFEKGFFRSLRSFSPNREKSREKRHRLTCSWKALNIKNALKSWDDVKVIISFQPETTYILKGILKLTTPVVTMFHFTPDKFISGNSYKFHKQAISDSEYIQVLMPEYVELLKPLHPKTKIICIPNIAPQYKNISALENKTIITVARVNPQKRPELLVNAFALIKDHFPDWVCEWYGETDVHSECMNSVMKLIKEKHLEDRIFFMGPCENVPEKLQNSSIFAFPSSYEGLSLALLEAFSMGLPSIGCKDCPSVNSLIHDGINGFLTDPAAEKFAEALSKLMSDKKLRQNLGQEAKKGSFNYSADRVWGSWDSLLKSVIQK